MVKFPELALMLIVFSDIYNSIFLSGQLKMKIHHLFFLVEYYLYCL